MTRPLNYARHLITCALFTLQASYASEEKSPPKQMVTGFNQSARVDVKNSWDVYTKGSFTYWQPIQENMELGVVSDTQGSSINAISGNTVQMGFDYKPGFQVGLGMELGNDNGDIYAQYTWFRGTQHVSRSLDVNNSNITLIPAWIVPSLTSPAYFFGSESWKLHMDLADLELARSHFTGPNLKARPFFGLRGAWIRQNLSVSYDREFLNRDSISISQISNSWGVGPRIGVDANWDLGAGFRFIGRGNGDILYTQYGKISFSQLDRDSNGTINLRHLVKNKNSDFLRAHAELALGMGWSTFLRSNRYHLDFAADYAFQIFMNQNVFRKFIDDQALASSILPNGNLYIQGLTVTMRLDF